MRTAFRLLLASCLLFGTAAGAADMTEKEMADARIKVQTAVALAGIARETQDGDAMLVAARLIASAGDVAMPKGSASGDGKPAMFDVARMAADAKAMGADAAKADAVAIQPTARPRGYWADMGCDAYYCNYEWVE